MLFRILGEAILGVLLAGIVMASLVPAAMQLGYETGPWMAWVAVAGSIAVCVAVGERRNQRRKVTKSP